jgi:hypothetical protein
MKLLLLVGFSFISFLTASAQKNGIVKGIAYDSISAKPINGATVTLLRTKDSSLVSFTMTDHTGSFQLTGLAQGDYRILLTHVGYHNRNKMFSISEQHKEVNLEKLFMADLSQLLDTVTVTAEAPPVTLIGDTIQYNAGSFKTPPNANVEQLLKNMPGIKIDKDGSITAQGQKVNKVLVDGKEFFGNDPKLATRNLPADAVDKVQSYDRLSDAAQLTGIDDGNSEKTLNLKLKADKKKGLFGKLSAGAGTAGRYENKFNLNSFKGARQFSAIGLANNTNAEGFSFMDLLNFTGELNRMRSGGGGGGTVMIGGNNSTNGLQSLAGSANTGLNTIRGGGVNYNNLIGNHTDFTSNLFYNHYSPRMESNIEREYLLPDSSYKYKQESVTENTSDSYRLNLGADIRLDSFHSLKISPSLGFQKTDNTSFSDYQTMSETNQVSNQGYSNNHTNTEGFNFRNEMLFRKKFRQKGRTFSLNLQSTLNKSDGKGILESINNFYTRSSGNLRNDSLFQSNTNSGSLFSYNVRAVYSEPVFKNALLEISLGKSNSVSKAEKTTYDYNEQSARYDKLNPFLTNDFSNTYGYTNAGLRLRAIKNQFNIAIGMNAQQADLEGKVTFGIKDSVIQQRFYNLLPGARLQYNFTRHKNITLTYNTQTTQPTMDQLQPVPDISDPLNIRAGNPELKQEYNHVLRLNFTSVNPFRNKNLFAFFTVTQTSNKIVNDDRIDDFGVKTTIPVNIDGVLTLTGSIHLGLPLPFLNGSVNISSNINYNKGKQFINSLANEIENMNLGPQLKFDLNIDPKFYVSAGAEFRYSNTSYSLKSAQNAVFLIQEYSTELNWEMPARFHFNTSYTYTINSQQAEGFNTRIPLWNASLSKQFLRYNRGEIKLVAFDLMNKNVGISRSANQNFIEDKKITNLRRYFLLNFTYSLSKNAASSKAAAGGLHLRVM